MTKKQWYSEWREVRTHGHWRLVKNPGLQAHLPVGFRVLNGIHTVHLLFITPFAVIASKTGLDLSPYRKLLIERAAMPGPKLP